jgi:hypothetical protein
MISGLIMASYAVSLWFALLSVSPAVCHEHADGDVEHSHGYGWFATSSRLIPTCATESDLAPSSRHYHLVLFGIEITILPGCAALEAGTLPTPQDSAISWNADHGGGLIAEHSISQHCDVSVSAMDSPAVSITVPETSVCCADYPVSCCAFARALRSGVQLI